MSMKSSADKMANTLLKIAARFPDRIIGALFTVCQPIMTEAKRLCPVSPTRAQLKAMGRSAPKGLVPGALRASGTVHEPTRLRKIITCILSFGAGPSRDYAPVQHERLDFHHTTGQALFLKQPIDEATPNIKGQLAEQLHFDKTGQGAE